MLCEEPHPSGKGGGYNITVAKIGRVLPEQNGTGDFLHNYSLYVRGIPNIDPKRLRKLGIQKHWEPAPPFPGVPGPPFPGGPGLQSFLLRAVLEPRLQRQAMFK